MLGLPTWPKVLHQAGLGAASCWGGSWKGRLVGWAGPCPQHLAPCRDSCQTPKEDLCSKFGMDLKRGMLLRLARQDPQLHPDDPDRRAAIYDKYKVRAPAFTYCSSWAPWPAA